MRAALKQIHASSHPKLNWSSINWNKVKKKVQELQRRIAKAVLISRYRTCALLLTERPGRLYAEAGL